MKLQFLFSSIVLVLLLSTPNQIQSQPLAVPVLLSPANAATNQTSSVKITWQAVLGADKYKVYVGSANHFNDVVNDTNYAGTSYQLSNLPNGTYTWRLNAKRSSPYQTSEVSAAWTFTVVGSTNGGGNNGGGTTGLLTPSLITPTKGSILQVLGANLSWTSVTGATSYIVKVATDALMTNVVFTDNAVTTTNRIAQNLTYNTGYYWTVQAANATSKSAVSNVGAFTTMPDNPNAVTTHPRLMFTQADLPRLRSWATASNPMYGSLQTALSSAIGYYNSKFFPNGQPNPVWPDNGGTTWTAAVTESYAEFFAFWSLIDPVVANRPIHAQRARNLLMYVINQASLGKSAGVPFRDPQFMTYDRSRVYGEACPLTVDWIYNAKDAQNNDILTTADKAKIRDVFRTWCNDQLTAYNHPTPVGLSNDKSISLTNRWILNNYYSGHARNLTFMSLSLDAADDAPVNPNLHFSALDNSLRSYIYNATGAWLYQQYAQFETPSVVSTDYNVPANGLGMGSGGFSAEGSLYGQSIGWVSEELLALKNAGWMDENVIGKQARLYNNAYWTRLMNALINTIAPAPQVPASASYLGPVYFAANYGDLLRSWVTQEIFDVTAAIGLTAMKSGDQNLLNKSLWFSKNALEGGSTNWIQRASNIWPNSYATGGINYFLLFDPATSANVPDPRPSMPTTFVDNSLNRISARTDWSTTATWFDWQCHWTGINHQSGDGNQFEFYRKGEWLIKERSGYSNDGIGYTSEFHNTLGLQNDVPANLQWFEGATSSRGGQWTNGVNNGDPSAITSVGNGFVYGTGDATNLYNRYNATDILFASRSIVWLEPNFIVVYDRAKSKTANRFKRFFLQFTAPPVISGKNVTVSTPGGQKVYVSNLLPTTSVLTTAPSEVLNSLAQLEQTTSELKIEDPTNPSDIRFLNVIQGADGNVSKDVAGSIQSFAGTLFEGSIVKNIAVLFPNVWNAAFSTTSYTVPSSVTSQIVTGLTPNGGYTVNLTPNGNNVTVTITNGGSTLADAGGVLVIGNTAISALVNHSTNLKSSALQASPNPFSDNTIISYELTEETKVGLKVVNILGEEVAILANDELQQIGSYEKVFNVGNLPNGIYLCSLKTGNKIENLRIVINK